MTPYGHSLRFTGNGVPWRSITASLVLLLLWDASGWDLPLMEAIGSPTGFPLRDNYWLENVLHTGARTSASHFTWASGWWHWPGPMVRIH